MDRNQRTTGDAILRRRTREERAAYLDGFEAGVQAMTEALGRINATEFAQRAEASVQVSLKILREVENDV
jgi:hypothetical protein